MLRQLQTILIACAATATFMPATASSQDLGSCACMTEFAGSVADVGALVEATGDVLVSQPAGFLESVPGSTFPLDARIAVGAQSSAVLQVGAGCRVVVPSNSGADISLVNNQLCVRITNPAVTAEENASLRRGIGQPEVIFGTLLLGAGAAGLLDDDDDRVSVSP